jgi:F0F1-type ATP synthase assembly protein I
MRYTPERPREGSAGRRLGGFERTMAISYGVIGAILLLGALGYVLDLAFDTAPAFLIGGVIAGVVVGLALLATFMMRRRGRQRA